MKTLGKIDVHGLTIRGEEHARNHDHFAVAALNKSMRLHQSNLSIDDDSRVNGHTQGHVFVVADGVSGAPAPARASVTAVDSVVQYFLNEMPWYHMADGTPEEVTEALEDALRNSQEELLRATPPGMSGMGTTMTLAFVAWPNLYLAHVGDSRCYLHRRGELRQLTTDHTIAEVRKRSGIAFGPEHETRLWNAVGGTHEGLHTEVVHLELEQGDVLTLMTDGVARARSQADLARILGEELEAEQACERLVDGRGDDDRTAIVVRFLPGNSASRRSARLSRADPCRRTQGRRYATRRVPDEARRAQHAQRASRRHPVLQMIRRWTAPRRRAAC